MNAVQHDQAFGRRLLRTANQALAPFLPVKRRDAGPDDLDRMSPRRTK